MTVKHASPDRVIRVKPAYRAADHQSVTAPRITARHLRQALATRSGVVVQDMADGSVYALPYGLTKAQAADESLVVTLTNVQAAAHLADADGDYAKAARTATTLLAWELELLETRTAGAR